MFFHQILHDDLGCASYVLADGGAAAVVDPRLDIEVYLELARTRGFQITHVIDTHDHADHVSGRARLAARTGGRALRAGAPGDGGIHGGDEISLGALRVRALAVPGHRPEHLAFTVADLTRGEDPWLVLTGDSLLVGDLARPDLASEAESGARAMHDGLAGLLELGDHVEVWPGHIGGSLCGGAGLSHKTSSTIGYERRHNPLLAMERDQFVAAITASLPPRPPSVARIVELNRTGAGEPRQPDAVVASELEPLLRDGVTVIDGRAPARFDACHLAGAVNLPLASPGVGTRAGWSLDREQPLLLVADHVAAAAALAAALQAVGLWRLEGYVLADPTSWRGLGLPLAEAAAWDVAELARALAAQTVQLVDVRDRYEWREGHVEGSHHLPLERIRELGRLPETSLPTAVACKAGARAAFAASLLRASGRRDVFRVSGGGVPDLAAHGIALAPGA